ncbi:membrane protein insertion efficiency factor YidD [Demequina maris]|uniref:membrane protein insertion efficiency factor YidD n=1 Tax=Demequina maris TaxID=1638982 RepID=UPI0009E56A29|nr:membrane protein insertion efficiency factor YidD [Demequina maris]
MTVAGSALSGLIRGYQRTISPLTGARCKYHPTCSHFALEAIEVHGAVVGSGLATWRLLRCNPWSNGGVDDVPAKGERLFRLTRNNAAMLTEPTSARPI